MAIPEQQPSPDFPIQERPDQPEIPVEIEAAGVRPVPTSPQPVRDHNQTIAQPVPVPSSTKSSIKIPAASREALEQLAKGKAEDAGTWFGVFWLKAIEKSIRDGLSVLFGNTK